MGKRNGCMRRREQDGCTGRRSRLTGHPSQRALVASLDLISLRCSGWIIIRRSQGDFIIESSPRAKLCLRLRLASR